MAEQIESHTGPKSQQVLVEINFVPEDEHNASKEVE